MRIDLNYGPQATPESSPGGAQKAAVPGSAPSPALGGEDQAQFSAAHVQVQELATLASQLPEVQQEKVQALRLAVGSGQYQVRPHDVATALLAHLLTDRAA
jgi:flagellar biosynthesis anti-sigma factor FlgM